LVVAVGLSTWGASQHLGEQTGPICWIAPDSFFPKEPYRMRLRRGLYV
ncbi:unnamed protein product, partial [Leptosia nina]